MHPIVYGKRFEPFYLWELCDYWSFTVQDYVKGLDVAGVAEKVIVDIRYPFYMGQPDDRHDVNFFHGKFCKTIHVDYWAKASEVALIKWGDCEDSSTLFLACCRALGVDAKSVYEAFGVVRDVETGKILGGHAWCYIEDRLGSGWRLYESTLDRSPLVYPKVEDPHKPIVVGRVKYEPWVIWNDEKYEEVKEENMFEKYAKMGFRDKETFEKHKAIEKAFNIKTKALKHRKILGRLRWK